MKKLIVVLVVALLLMSAVPAQAAPKVQRYSFVGVQIGELVRTIEVSVKEGKGAYTTCTYYIPGEYSTHEFKDGYFHAFETAADPLAFCVANYEGRVLP